MSIFFKRYFSCKKQNYLSKGFTLIEMMVVLAIVLIIVTIVLTSATSYNSSILLRSIAYEIGQSFREAQLYGIAVEGGSGATSFKNPYGVYMDNTILNVNGAKYTLFADSYPPGAPDGVYTSGQDGIQSQFQLPRNFAIINFCAQGVLNNASVIQCAADCPTSLPSGVACTPNAITWFSATFKRPSPDARILVGGTPPGGNTSTLCNDLSKTCIKAFIYVGIVNKAMRLVTLSSPGQIVVQQCLDSSKSQC